MFQRGNGLGTGAELGQPVDQRPIDRAGQAPAQEFLADEAIRASLPNQRFELAYGQDLRGGLGLGRHLRYAQQRKPGDGHGDPQHADQ